MSSLTQITERSIHSEDRWRLIHVLNDIKVDPDDRQLATRYVAKNAPDVYDMLFGGSK